MTEPTARATEGARPLAGCLDRLAPPRTGSVTTPHEHHHHPRACTSRRPLRQRRPVPAGARRDAGARRRGGDGVPRQLGVAPGRVPRRRGLLRHLRLPDHAAADRRARALRHGEPARLLPAAGPPVAAGAVHAAHRDHGVHRAVAARRARPAAGRRHRRHHVRLELVPDLGRPGLHRDGRLRAAAAPVVVGGGGAVLPDLAGRDDPAAAGRATAPARRQLGSAHRRPRHHRRDGRPLLLGPDRDV